MKNNDKTSFFEELQEKMSKAEIEKIYKEMSTNIFTEKALLETNAIKGAIDAIKKISKKYDIYIITARIPQLIVHVEKWLEKNNIKQYIKEVLSSFWVEKQDICCQYNIDFLCSDDKRHLEKEKIDNRVLFNEFKHTNCTQIKQVNSWKEIEKILL